MRFTKSLWYFVFSVNSVLKYTFLNLRLNLNLNLFHLVGICIKFKTQAFAGLYLHLVAFFFHYRNAHLFYIIKSLREEAKVERVEYSGGNNILYGSFIKHRSAEVVIKKTKLAFAFYKKMIFVVNKYAGNKIAQVAAAAVLK